MTFDVDATGETADLGPFLNPNCPMVTPPEVNYTVAVRATDSCTPPNVIIIDTCVVTVDTCCSDQELFYDFLGCGSQSSPTTYCMGWEGGGCGLQNSSATTHGAFKWGCENVQQVCSMTHPYLLVAGSGSFHGGGFVCNVLWYLGDYADYNVVSPSINLPPSTNSYFELDRCTSFPAGSTAYLYISENDCDGPWIELWRLTVSDGCVNDTTIDLSGYEGSNVMFRFRYTWPDEWSFWNSDCGAPMEDGNEGITIDDIRIAGCFSGTLEEN